MNELESLKKRIFSKGTKDIDKFLIHAHHKFMKHYGWIKVEDFVKIPIPTFMNLVQLINKEEEAEAKAWKGKK